MKPIRILNVVTRMDAAGIETLLMNLYRNIDREKIQFDFLTHREEAGFYDEEILKLGGRIYSVPSINPFHHKRYIKSLEKFFEDHDEYKIVHSHINTYSMYPLRAAKNAGVPIRIAHSHIASVPFDKKTPFRIYTKAKLKEYSTHNFACSQIAGKWLYGLKAIKKDNFKVINNSINATLYKYNKKTREIIRNELGIEGKFVVGHIGRFTEQKNHIFLINIFKLVYDKNKNARLLLVGEGEDEVLIRNKVIELGLEKCVIFTGIRNDVEDLLQAMDVFVFPSLYEGLGMVVIEAQAAGLKCIVSNNIPKEAFITDLIYDISLKESRTIWAEKILEYSYGYERRDTFKNIYDAGYDIHKTVTLLEEFYLGEIYKL